MRSITITFLPQDTLLKSSKCHISGALYIVLNNLQIIQFNKDFKLMDVSCLETKTVCSSIEQLKGRMGRGFFRGGGGGGGGRLAAPISCLNSEINARKEKPG